LRSRNRLAQVHNCALAIAAIPRRNRAGKAEYGSAAKCCAEERDASTRL